MLRWVLIIALILAPALGVMTWRTVDLTRVRPHAIVAAPPARGAPVDVQAAARRLSQAIRFKTVAGPDGAPLDPEPFHRLVEWMGGAYPALSGVAKREQINEFSLLYTWPGSDPEAAPVLLIGHLDVPAPQPAPANVNAALFSGAMREDAVWGAGAMVGKGPLVAMLEAGEALAAKGYKPRRTIYFAFGQDGAAGGRVGARQIAQVLAARKVKAWFALSEGPSVVAAQEFTGKPAAMIGVAEKRDLTLLVTASGAAAPGAPRAVTDIAQALVALDAMPTGISLSDTTTRAMIRALAHDFSLPRAFAIANSWAFGPLIAMELRASRDSSDLLGTTLAPTLIEGGANRYLAPGEAMAMINVRLHPRDTPEDIMARARAVVATFPGVKLDWAERPGPEVPIASDRSDAYRLVSSHAARAAGGASVAPCLAVRAGDSRFYTPVAQDVYRFTPAVWTRADVATMVGPAERLSQANLARMIEFYQGLIAEGGE